MKKLAVAVLFVLIAALPSWAIPLPPEVTGTFTGSFVSATYGVNIPLSGTFIFSLYREGQRSDSYLHSAYWIVNGSTDDGALNFTGAMNNERVVDHYRRNEPASTWPRTWQWDQWVDANLYVEENISGTQDRLSPAVQWGSDTRGFSGEPWDLITNEDFLPTSGVFDLFNGEDSAQLTLNFRFDDATSPAPVPEPATILLLGSGLAGLAAWRRKQR